MAKKTKEPEIEQSAAIVPERHIIHPLTQEFGNGDLNILRDKINEIIKSK